MLTSVSFWMNYSVGRQKRKVLVFNPTPILKSGFKGIKVSFHAPLKTN